MPSGESGAASANDSSGGGGGGGGATTTTTTRPPRPSSKGYHPAPACNDSPRAASLLSPRSERGSKACCFCWCCCCSCSWSSLTVQQNQDNKTRQNEKIELIEEKPTLEEVICWGTSFDKLMKSRLGQKCFADFLKSEYSDENILFWQACEDLKRESSPEKIQEKARLIYEDFISILSPKEVSLDSRVREIINNNMIHPNQHTFDDAQLQVYTLMHRDSYPRFVNSLHYKQLLQTLTSPPDEL